jgi:hypothetical protein
MQPDKQHNKLYKLAIVMDKYNGKGVKRNLELLLSTLPARNNDATVARQ